MISKKYAEENTVTNEMKVKEYVELSEKLLDKQIKESMSWGMRKAAIFERLVRQTAPRSYCEEICKEAFSIIKKMYEDGGYQVRLVDNEVALFLEVKW